ncbi:3-keto-5-aminohexanoate cleavage protein [Hyphomonas johnsonii]|uniref:Class III aminotransferase n=1 Tax=Hyphomonas johnsonii MHS-2 TaxID=1280950 RepID=A0A059FBF9_9PROT|nr:3-keto-5-aminohexanoate cleavage protein [Hyphomonas johnsonii]KCZ87949.1 hypothetical protein HJO_16235 [Hyphomonas johnsonii MHS-2]
MNNPERLISVAPNGARKLRADHPALPLSPEDIAADAAACVAEGASLLHLHVRDAEGRHSLSADAYKAAINAVRDQTGSDLIIQITTESAGIFDRTAQIAVVESVRPESCSVALRELSPNGSQEEVATYRQFLADCRRESIWVQHILYDADDVRRFSDLRADGVYGEELPFILLVVGRYRSESQSDTLELRAMLDALDESPAAKPVWAACAFGQGETNLLSEAARSGGHVRVGFENNFLMADGSLAGSNASRVGEVAAALGSLGLSPMSADGARKAFKLRRYR